MNAEQAILELGEATAASFADALETFAPGAVERGAVGVVEAGSDPLAAIQAPAVAVTVSYGGGVVGGSMLVLPIAAGRQLAAAVAGTEPPAVGAELSEAEQSALQTAMNRIMQAVAGAVSALRGEQVEMAGAVTQLLVGPGGSDAVCPRTPLVLTMSLTLFGERSRLVQFVPEAFAARPGGAPARRDDAQVASAGGAVPPPASGSGLLNDVKLRVWAELGRARLPVGRAVGLGRGSVVELDREVDDPVDVYANGHRIGTGRLLLVEDGEWAVQIERLSDPRDEGGRNGG